MSHIVGKIVLFLWQVGHFPTDLCVKFCRDRLLRLSFTHFIKSR